ncbi:hypothetical protein LSAT2_032387 [Lamellibrachia satsuma]|nr:hypothetical protein LSAT2_032387 [Lamellibrachia satsuma]
MTGGGSTARALTITEIGFSTRLAKWSGDGPVGVTTVTKGPARTEVQVHLSVTSGHGKTTAPDSTRASPLETNDVSRLKQSSSNAGGDANDAVVDGNTSSVNKLYRRADQVYPAAIRQLATATTSISHRPSSTK